MRPALRSLLVAAPLVGALLLSGCGAEPEQDRSAAPEPAASPSATESAAATKSAKPKPAQPPSNAIRPCSKTWVDGRAFPDYYKGCTLGGKLVKSRPLICESMQRIYTYGDHFWAVGGARVVRTDGPYRDDPQYRKAHRACTA